ncbi:MAG: hypothetical protein KF865_00010 [Bdellovibrionaceae bacterium]|nr:hypothetical protein [Pseudobdellovibrionaceae bacterium]
MAPFRPMMTRVSTNKGPESPDFSPALMKNQGFFMLKTPFFDVFSPPKNRSRPKARAVLRPCPRPSQAEIKIKGPTPEKVLAPPLL